MWYCTTFPRESKTKVGVALIRSRLENALFGSAAFKKGNAPGWAWIQRRIVLGLSPLTVTIFRSANVRLSRRKNGNAILQGPHHVAQKNNNVAL